MYYDTGFLVLFLSKIEEFTLISLLYYSVSWSCKSVWIPKEEWTPKFHSIPTIPWISFGYGGCHTRGLAALFTKGCKLQRRKNQFDFQNYVQPWKQKLKEKYEYHLLHYFYYIYSSTRKQYNIVNKIATKIDRLLL